MKLRILLCIFPGLVAFLPIGQIKTSRAWPHPEFTGSHNQFAFRLLNTVLQQDTVQNNKLIAPLSLYFSLGMLCNGAAKATRDSIGEALSAGEMDIPNLNSGCKEALQQMPLIDNTVQILMANSIWYNRKRMTLSPTYESISGNFFYAQPQPLTFGNRDATTRINQWVDKNTGHMIPTIIDRSNPTDGMYLLSAFYFKGNWKQPFETENSFRSDFYLRPDVLSKKDGGTKKAAYMNKTAVIRTFSDTAFTMVELPCGDGTNYSLFALLPENEIRSAQGLALSLTPDRFNDALGKLTPQLVNLSLPGWECTYAIDDLYPALNQLGMGIAFNGEADFSNMYSIGGKKAWLSQARHSTCIRVNENGIEAAAANGSGGTTFVAPLRSRRQPRVVTFDRPFLYMLIEKQRNLLLLTGIVNDPTLRASPVVDVAPKKRPVIQLRRRKK